ncbi:MAG TPA: hypothetical protein VEK11_03555 [Thermoanaerobaculia bacterium]|nr:hypothetical protein [Thermoanaerobaculia bacterium]
MFAPLHSFAAQRVRESSRQTLWPAAMCLGASCGIEPGSEAPPLRIGSPGMAGRLP